MHMCARVSRDKILRFINIIIDELGFTGRAEVSKAKYGIRSCQRHPSSFSQSERHKQFAARREAAMSGLQGILNSSNKS